VRLETGLAISAIIALAGVAASVGGTIASASAAKKAAKIKTPAPQLIEAEAETGREGAEAAARESARRRRRLQQGRQGTITGAGAGLLNENGARGGGTGDY
jgi:hypothetical protein